MTVIKNKRIMKCLLMMVVSLLLILNFSIGVSASNNYDRQEADACITISGRLSVKTSYGKRQETTYEYDKLGRITSATDELGTINYTYDGCGNVLTVSETDKDGNH
ncbi:MAG: RHS repeat protein [Lachnospiraceae bacterium]|nr:RHS repeat protein [Lachnospiraceae bacterium]